MKTNQFLAILLAGLLTSSICAANSGHPAHAHKTVSHHVEPVLPTARQIHELDEALSEFQHGKDAHKPQLSARGLDHAVRLLVEMKRHGVKLKFNPLKYHNDEIGRLLEKHVRFEKIAMNRSVVVKKLRTCFLIAHLACGYDFHDPANSNITDVTEVQRPGPMSPFRPRLSPI